MEKSFSLLFTRFQLGIRVFLLGFGGGSPSFLAFANSSLYFSSLMRRLFLR